MFPFKIHYTILCFSYKNVFLIFLLKAASMIIMGAYLKVYGTDSV